MSGADMDIRYLRDIVRALNPNETREATRIIDALEQWKNTASNLSSACARQQGELVSLRAELAEAKKWGTDLSNELGQRTAELAAARRQIEEAGKQEPVGFRWLRAGSLLPDSDQCFPGEPTTEAVQTALNRSACIPQKLYARPVPQQPSAAPEAVAKDAERYRWLRSSDAVGVARIFSRKIDDATVGLESMYAGENLDAVIDAILSANEVKK